MWHLKRQSEPLVPYSLYSLVVAAGAGAAAAAEAAARRGRHGSKNSQDDGRDDGEDDVYEDDEEGEAGGGGRANGPGKGEGGESGERGVGNSGGVGDGVGVNGVGAGVGAVAAAGAGGGTVGANSTSAAGLSVGASGAGESLIFVCWVFCCESCRRFVVSIVKSIMSVSYLHSFRYNYGLRDAEFCVVFSPPDFVRVSQTRSQWTHVLLEMALSSCVDKYPPISEGKTSLPSRISSSKQVVHSRWPTLLAAAFFLKCVITVVVERMPHLVVLR